jgi:hypothetical protein
MGWKPKLTSDRINKDDDIHRRTKTTTFIDVLLSDQSGLSLCDGGGLDGVGSDVSVCNLLCNSLYNRGNMLDRGGILDVLDRGGILDMLDRGGVLDMLDRGSSILDNRGCFNHRGGFDNGSCLDNGGCRVCVRSVCSTGGVVRVVVVVVCGVLRPVSEVAAVGKGRVVSIRISIGTVVGICLGFSLSLSFSLTLLAAIDGCGSYGGSRKTGG